MTARAVTDDRIAVRLLADDWVEVAGLLGEEVARIEARVAGMVPSADDEEFGAALDAVHALRLVRAAIVESLRREGVTA